MGSGGENDPTTAPDAEGEAEASAPSGPTVKMHRADTPTDMTNVATEISTEAIRRHQGAWREAAAYIKKEMDKKYPVDTTPGKSDGVFHAIVGTSFAASVSHETRAFIHMQIGIAHVILFKSKDSPFDVDQPSFS